MTEFKYSPIKDLLLQSDSDKQSGHRYGFFYELLLNSLFLKKQRQLNILEIGVSVYGNGSLFTWQNSDLIKRCVGIDILDYHGNLNDKSVFYKLDAYDEDTIYYLQETEGILFDVIIDDGTHKHEDQEWFFEHYLTLLQEEGYLVCEDVSSLKFINKMCQQDNVFCFDGWANRKLNIKSFNQDPNLYFHKERILVMCKHKDITDGKTHEYKKHILQLPDIECHEYDRLSKELAVSIPLFHSELDTQYKEFDVDRFQEIHVKGAIWSGLSFVHNTDLSDKGTPLYFHVEDKVFNYAKPVFDRFKIPEDWIKKVSVPSVNLEYKINKTHFGKKFIPLLDKSIDPDVLLILDSDLFTCTDSSKLPLYNKLTSTLLKTQPSMTYFRLRNLDYWWYVMMISLASGMPGELVHKHPLGKLEVEAYKRLGFEKEPTDVKPKEKIMRYFAENYMITFPKNHKIREYTVKHIPTCFTSPYLHSAWAEYNQPIIELATYLDLPIYDWENDFIDGKKGYKCFTHIRVNKSKNKKLSLPSKVNLYWEDFYNLVKKHVI